TPLDTARISSDWAATKAVLAAAASPPVTASSNLRRKVRTRERRAVLTSVRRAILRIAFLAPGLLAIGRTLRCGLARPGRANWRRGYTESLPPGQCVLRRESGGGGANAPEGTRGCRRP